MSNISMDLSGRILINSLDKIIPLLPKDTKEIIKIINDYDCYCMLLAKMSNGEKFYFSIQGSGLSAVVITRNLSTGVTQKFQPGKKGLEADRWIKKMVSVC
jgi:hypothetical protein